MALVGRRCSSRNPQGQVLDLERVRDGQKAERYNRFQEECYWILGSSHYYYFELFMCKFDAVAFSRIERHVAD